MTREIKVLILYISTPVYFVPSIFHVRTRIELPTEVFTNRPDLEASVKINTV